jgi:hypothetical protein
MDSPALSSYATWSFRLLVRCHGVFIGDSLGDILDPGVRSPPPLERTMKRRAAILLAAFALGAATACAGEPTKPPRVLPVSDVLAGERVRVWNATNDEAVASLTEKRVEYEALAEAKESSGQSPESSAAEDASYMRAADRIQQYIDAVCALPDTKVC